MTTGITEPPSVEGEMVLAGDDAASETPEKRATTFYTLLDVEPSPPKISAAETLGETSRPWKSDIQSSEMQEEAEHSSMRQVRSSPTTRSAETEPLPSKLVESPTIQDSPPSGPESDTTVATRKESSHTTYSTTTPQLRIQSSSHLPGESSEKERSSKEISSPTKEVPAEQTLPRTRVTELDREAVSSYAPIPAPLPPEPTESVAVAGVQQDKPHRPGPTPPLVEPAPILTPSTSFTPGRPSYSSKESQPVKVRIGTIEVKATTLQEPAPPRAPKPQGFKDYVLIRNYLTRRDY